MTTLLPCTVLLAALLNLTGAGDPGQVFRICGDYRLRTTYLSEIVADRVAEGGEEPVPAALGQNLFGEHRLRLEPELHLIHTPGRELVIKAQAEIFSGLLFGDTAAIGSEYAARPRDEVTGLSFDTFDPRRLWLEWRLPVGLLKAGQMGSQWGRGIVANDGDGYGVDFGDKHFGDTVDRVLFATKPLMLVSEGGLAERLITVLGVDVIYRDDHADVRDGDRAVEGVLAIAYQGDEAEEETRRRGDAGTRRQGEEKEGNLVGLYAAYRDQEDEVGDYLRALALDLHLRWGLEVTDLDARAFIDIEVAWLQGETTMVSTPQSLSARKINALGYAARGGLRWPDLTVALEVGHASGDDNPQDEEILNFTFDPDYNVGLVMFEEVAALMTAAAAENLADPALVGEAPAGVEALPSNGGVTNATYMMPVVRYRPIEPLTLKVALLYARADEDIVDPFHTFEAGGVKRNFRGGDSGLRDLGVELDLGVDYRLGMQGAGLIVGIQYGHFFPGSAFEDAEGLRPDPVDALQGRLTLIW